MGDIALYYFNRRNSLMEYLKQKYWCVKDGKLIWFHCCRYDFFLVSQSVRQGTVTPTHYNIIYDNTGLKPDHMQRLTYKLCHLYYNWPVSWKLLALKLQQYVHVTCFVKTVLQHSLCSHFHGLLHSCKSQVVYLYFGLFKIPDA